MNAEQRIRGRSVRDGRCLVWTGATLDNGYGIISIDGRVRLVHRVMFEHAVAPLESGMQVDHLCHNRACVEPSHLRQVTRFQNQANRAGPNANNRSSGIRNVSWCKAKAKWHVQVGHQRRSVNGGYFDDLAEAALAAVQLRRRLHGPPLNLEGAV